MALRVAAGILNERTNQKQHLPVWEYVDASLEQFALLSKNIKKTAKENL